MTMDFNCQSVINPLLDIGKFLIAEQRASDSYGGYTDPELDKMFDDMNQTGDEAEQRG